MPRARSSVLALGQRKIGRRFSEACSPQVMQPECVTMVGLGRKRRHSENEQSSAKRARTESPEFVPLLEDHPETSMNTLKHITLSPAVRCTSLAKFLQTLNVKLHRRFTALLAESRGIKAYLAIHVFYAHVHGGSRRFEAFLATKMTRITGTHAISKTVQRFEDEILERHANFMRHQSGLVLDEVQECALSVASYAPLLGSSYVKLPAFLEKKHAIVNVRNKDNRCFGYAVLSCLEAAHAYTKNLGGPEQYNKYFKLHHLDALKYPVELSDIAEIERRLEISINVFSFYDDDGRARYPVYISEFQFAKSVDLLYWNGHFAWIKSFERFMYDINKSHKQKHFCRRCLCHFSLERVLDKHVAMCTGEMCQPVMTMPPPNTVLAFQNVRFLQQLPFVIYADFECLTTPIGDADAEGRRTKPYQAHVPCSVGLIVANTAESNRAFKYEWYTGTDVCDVFLNRILAIEDECVAYIFDDIRMKMTNDDRKDFSMATDCYICGKPFIGDHSEHFNAKKVRDHDHATGKYRGAAHQTCNLRLRKTYKIPVIFHNFRGYDSHLLIAALGKHKGRCMSVIGQGMEKYLTINWGDHIVFKDSLQFLGASLDSLVSCLLNSGRDKFRYLLEAFKDLPTEKVDLLLKKGVYPYDYVNSWDKLKESKLPEIRAFSNKLRGEECSVENYARAQSVWAVFECRSMKDYHELYLKTDVLLLADVFESFRTGCLENYKLDPAHYVSAPHLSWDAMLKMTQCRLQLLDDSEMFRMLDNNLRGGICMITKRYARANNSRLGTHYDPCKPVNHIMYWDANNLYGWAMSQALPEGEFRWLDRSEFDKIEWKTLSEDAPVGYIVECDLDYPTKLHCDHSDYPLAPEKVAITVEMLSDKQIDIHRHYSFNRSSVQTKLIPNLLPKERYCCHYRNLQFYLKHGMILNAVHRVLTFKQSKWMSPYIATNQNLRAAARDEFLKKLYKDMNNSCFGKTCENQKKRTDIRLVTDATKCKKLVEKPHCRGFRIFTKDIAAINMSKIQTLINRPFYVGFTVLELSKLHMYRFHYDVVKRIYPGHMSQLLFTDTDSLMYQIFADDVYEKVWNNRDLFDLAGYPPDFHHDNTNNKVIGKFKDEANSEPILEFVGLRPKMYSFVTAKDCGAQEPLLVEKLRAKGIQRATVSLLRHQDFLTQLRDPRENYLSNRRIGSKLHDVFTFRSKKRGLCAFDDKRYILSNGIDTLAYGHQEIAARVHETAEPDGRTILNFADAVKRRMPLQAHQIEFPAGLDPKNAAAEARKRKLESIAEPVNDMDELVDLVFN